jgi:predicted phosphodiesterase
MNKKITGIVVKEYLERFPNVPSLTLAKKIYTENSTIFLNVESARNIIRYYRGQNGNNDRKRLSTNKYLKEAGSLNPFAIPESDETTWNPIHIPERFNNGLVFSDSHFPYHNVEAINAMIDYTIGHRKINFILINGDGLDCYQLSKFNKDMRNRSFSDELWMWVEFLNILQKTFPDVKIYWKLGNHEERWENYLRVKAPELLDMEEYKFENIIKIRGIENVDVIEHQIIYTGRLPWVHGHELQGGAASPVNPARGLFLKTLSSAVVSHHHRSSAHSELDINEKLMSWWSIGCLCGLHPEWNPINKWNQGFALIETSGKDFAMSNMKIYRGTVYKD